MTYAHTGLSTYIGMYKCVFSQDRVFELCEVRVKVHAFVTPPVTPCHCVCSNGCHPAVPDVGQRLPLHYACAHLCAVCISSITSSNEGLTVRGG